MEQVFYKQNLRQKILEFGINQEEVKFWDFLLDGFDEQGAKDFLENLEQNPDLFPLWHHNLVKKCMWLKTKGTESDWQKILKEEQETINKLKN